LLEACESNNFHREEQEMPPPSAGTEADELLAVARAVAHEAADQVLAQRERGVGEVDTKTTATDLVTAADRVVESLIVARLRAARPGDALLGEESGAHGQAPATGVRWVVDPIDGTVNYVYGLPPYAVSIAAEVAGIAVAAVVRNAANGEEWSAVRGGGAWRDGRRLRGSRTATLDQALVATGFGYDPARRAHQARVLADLLPRVRDIRRLGAASVDLCHAAEGRVDAYYEKGLHAWDHAAGALIAVEAGLLVTGLRGAPPGPQMVLAAPPGLHQALHDRLVADDADGGP
jgi:myo-inositol-1(or 4)-monophosphatase